MKKQITIPLIILTLSLPMTACTQPSNASFTDMGNIKKEGSTLTTESLEQRGKQLREALKQAYKERKDAGLLTTSPLKSKRAGNDVAAVVLQYIPVGMSFDDAEIILRSAGLKVQRPSAKTLSEQPDRYEVISYDKGFIQQFLGGASIYIYIYPAIPGDYSKVNAVTAEFVLQYL